MAGTVVWIRQDLRVSDHPALAAAREQGGPVYPVFIWAPHEEGDWPPGGATKWWLHSSLLDLQQAFHELNMPLVIRHGNSLEVLRAFARETKSDRILWNRRYEPTAIQRDAGIKTALRNDGLEIHSFSGNLLFEPHEIATKTGTPYRVFTPYSKACGAKAVPEPLPAPIKQACSSPAQSSLSVEELELLPKIRWDAGFSERWTPGRAGALQSLKVFLDDTILDYSEDRNLPDRPGTSSLSPALHFGELSPREVWRAIVERCDNRRGSVEPFLRQLIWREFAHHLLFHYPDTPTEPLRQDFQEFPWADDSAGLVAWQQGQTGYPFVDAGMRELWVTGWMHNRVRMVVASFLVKDLLIPWQAGAAWFWDTLVDADLANNTLGWQWVAGCGADAAPFFRVFNPVGQGEKFDPDGRYIRRWVPELSALPTKWLHRPWEAPDAVLNDAGIVLGRDYPEPIVDHAQARTRALAAYAAMRTAQE